MSIIKIQGQYFRCLPTFCWEFDSNLTVFYGPNASGKTSMLEAIYWSLTGKSFRVRDTRVLIQDQAPYCAANVVFSEPANEISLIRYRDAALKVKMDNVPLQRWSDVAFRQPVLFVDTHTHRQFGEHVEFRRKWLDWMMFHVEPNYLQLQRNYKKALDQRMYALRFNIDPEPWERAIVHYSVLLENMRRDCLQEVYSLWKTREGFLQDISLVYDIGYEEGDLSMLLIRQRQDDLKKGYAQSGAHRFDVDIKLGNYDYNHRLSLGQQKIVVTELMLLSAMFLDYKLGKKVLCLMDDLAAELDDAARFDMLSRFSNLGLQCVVTTLDAKWSCVDARLVSIGSVLK